MCSQKTTQVLCLQMAFTYQFALVYAWIVFIFTSTYDIEIINCPRKVTGRVIAVYPYNSSDE